MAFYLRPPSGLLSLTSLEECAVKRLKFLMSISEFEDDYATTKDFVDDPNTMEESGSYLVEGSRNDRIGHFFLRLISSQDASMKSFFITNETRLFRFRFSCMSREEILTLLSSMKHEICKILSRSKLYPSLTNVLTVIQTSLKLNHMTSQWCRTIVDHYVTGDTQTCLHLPFTYALTLVSRRLVVMDCGTARVSCDRLGTLLVELYRHVLEVVVQIAGRLGDVQLADRRYRVIAQKCRRLFYCTAPRLVSVTSSMSHDQVDDMISSFPACMVRVHQRLRHDHRLPHHDRVSYTLFLKEVGLTVHEAIKFWRTEYSRTPRPGCNHGNSWTSDGRRYVYNIRHLYGLEGSKVNYRGHSCLTLQERGVCPYTASTSSTPYSCPDTSLHKPRDSPRPCHTCLTHLVTDIEDLVLKQYPTSQHVLDHVSRDSIPEVADVSKPEVDKPSSDQIDISNESRNCTIIKSPRHYVSTFQKFVACLQNQNQELGQIEVT